MEENKVEINVNGKKFEVSQNIVDKIVLSDCEASNIFINSKINSETDLYFERNAEIFVCILSFYQGRGLHIPNKLCPGEFQEELQYWGVDSKYLSQCCMGHFIRFCDDKEILLILEKDQKQKENNRNELKKRIQGKNFWKSVQAKGWLILDEPSTSVTAKVS